MRYGELNAKVVGGAEVLGATAQPEPDELIVVLLHGFGAPADDLVPLARAIRAPTGTRFIFPEAPLSFSMGFGESRAWWMIDLMHIQSRLLAGELEQLKCEVPVGLEEARRKLESLLDAVQAKHGVSSSRIVLGGFSQGAMLALDLALMSDRSFAGLMLFSGTIICAQSWRKRFAERKSIPILQSHGQVDPILPFVFAVELRDMLVSAGFEHTWVPFMGGHEIPPPVLQAAGAFLSKR